MADGDDIPRQSGKSREWILKYGLVGPVLVFLVSFNLFPLFYNIVLSFSNSKLTRDGFDWIGTKNYGRLFDVATHPEYAAALQTTALFVVLAVSIELLLGFFLALSLRDKFKGKTVILIILLIPMMLSPAVMGIFWRYVLDAEFGVINQFLSMLKVSPPVWQRDWKFTTILLIDIWMWTPFMMLISLAAMVARGRLDRGVKLNYPEAIALITDFVVEGARDGKSVADLMSEGGTVVCRDQVMDGISEMIPDVQVDHLFPSRHLRQVGVDLLDGFIARVVIDRFASREYSHQYDPAFRRLLVEYLHDLSDTGYNLFSCEFMGDVVCSDKENNSLWLDSVHDAMQDAPEHILHPVSADTEIGGLESAQLFVEYRIPSCGNRVAKEADLWIILERSFTLLFVFLHPACAGAAVRVALGSGLHWLRGYDIGWGRRLCADGQIFDRVVEFECGLLITG